MNDFAQPVSLLSSAAADSPHSRWSYAPSAPILHLRCDWGTGRSSLRAASGVVREWASPLEALEFLSSTLCEHPQREGPPFKGGWIGQFSYDLGRFFEPLPSIAQDPLRLPLFDFYFHPRVLAHDLRTGQTHDCRVRHDFPSDPIQPPAPQAISRAPVCSTFTRPRYEAAVERALEYIRAGDIFQVNLSQRFSAGLPLPPAAVYQRLLDQSPAWFGAYLDFGDYCLVSNSPELFLRIDPCPDGSRHVLTRPIKGTRPRGERYGRELLRSEKDTAELNMIIDLERNDLGRICEIGSVQVSEPRVIEAHPTVVHGVAGISGRLRPEIGLVELLRATFPGGSVTGAPKIRAMQIIEELEPVRRGPYCGAIGYLSTDGHLQLNLAIRTLLIKDGLAHLPVGGGIVADSVPSQEYDETIVKAQALTRALGLESLAL